MLPMKRMKPTILTLGLMLIACSVISEAEEPKVRAASPSPFESAAQSSGMVGALSPDEFPSDAVSNLYNTGRPQQYTPGQQSSTSSSSKKKDERRIGSLVSLLDPPPGFVMPELNDQQKQNYDRLKELRQGVGTVVYMRATGNLDGLGMNCGLGYMNDYFKDNFVGIPTQFYRNGELCGLCMRLWCVDSICKEPLIANRTFMIADSCQDCRGNNIVTSARGLQDLAGVNYNDNPSIQVAWEFVQCDEYIEGGIKLWPSDNNSPVFLGINLSNTKELIGAVRINNMELQRTNYGFWVIDTPGKEIPLRPPYTIQIIGSSGRQLVTRTTALVAQDLGINF